MQAVDLGRRAQVGRELRRVARKVHARSVCTCPPVVCTLLRVVCARACAPMQRVHVVACSIFSAGVYSRLKVIDDEVVVGLRHERGVLSLAKGAPDTGSSSFSIMLGDAPVLV